MQAPRLLPPPIDTDPAYNPGPEGQATVNKARGMLSPYADGLVLESYQSLMHEFGGMWDRCQRNLELFLYGRARGQRTGKYIVRKIQNACISNTAIETATPPRFTVKERVTGEPPVWYFNAAAAPPEFQQFAQPDQPLDPNTVAMFQQLIAQDRMQSAMTGQRPTISPDILVRVDDASMREALETVLASKFEAGQGTRFLRQNILYKNIFGYQFMSIGWDDAERRPKFYNIQPVCVHLDRDKTDVSECAYFIWDEFLGKDEALQLYSDPEVQKAIKEYATTGQPILAGNTPYVFPRFWKQQIFYRPVVIVRHMYLRYQQYPCTPEEALARGGVLNAAMTEQEAIAGGHVVPTQVEVPQEPQPLQMPTANDEGTALEEDASRDESVDEDELPDTDDANSQPAGEVDTGVIVPDGDSEQPATAPLTRTALVHPESGEEIDAAHPLWPTKLVHPTTGETMDARHKEWPTRAGLRQVKIVAGRCVEDRECERINFPFMHNINIEIPGTPFGQGEPERLEYIADAYNRTVTDIVVNGEYSANPACITTPELMKENPALQSGAFSTPGKTYKATQAQLAAFGGASGNGLPIKVLMPPPTPPDQWRREPMLRNILTDSSDQSASLRGEAPTSNASGRTVEALQSAGTSTIMYKSNTTETAAAYMAQVIIGDILIRMSPDELAKDFPKYPIYIWEELHRRLVNHYLLCEVSVELAAGGASARRSRAADLMNAKAQGVFVSDPSILEAMDLDPEQEIQKQAQFQRDQMSQMQNMPMGAQPGGAPVTNAGQPAQQTDATMRAGA